MGFAIGMIARQETEGLLSHLDAFIEKLNECCENVETGSDLWRDLIIITGLAVRCENEITGVVMGPASTIMREVFKHTGHGDKHED